MNEKKDNLAGGKVKPKVTRHPDGGWVTLWYGQWIRWHDDGHIEFHTWYAHDKGADE